VRAHPDQRIALEVERDGQRLELALHPDAEQLEGETIGRIGAYPHVDREQMERMRVTVRYGPLQAWGRALDKTWDITVLTLRVLWKLVTGEAALSNISGPVTIAEYAGVSALIGVSAFLGMLALFSISIGILNLLPVPVLDGGHLLYYLVELIKGSPVSETTEAVGQRIGFALLAGLMALALYNDFARLLG
jgi:regulator of sigma E protease